MYDTSIEAMNCTNLLDVANVHMAAFHGYPNTSLGRKYVIKFIRWFCDEREAISLNAIDSEGKVLGYVIGAPVGYTKELNSALMVTVSLQTILRPWLILNPKFRHSLFRRIISTFVGEPHVYELSNLPHPAYSLVGIAVLPKLQGNKLGSRLIAAFEEETEKRNVKSLRLSVYSSNVQALSLYKKMGWQLVNHENNRNNVIHYYKLLPN